MTRHSSKCWGVLAAAVLLSACSEAPQNASGVRSDQAAHAGVGKSQYLQAGWSVGDRTSWQQQLKARAQYGMNEYSRAAKP